MEVFDGFYANWYSSPNANGEPPQHWEPFVYEYVVCGAYEMCTYFNRYNNSDDAKRIMESMAMVERLVRSVEHALQDAIRRWRHSRGIQ
jgi:S-formylglutathione hydrolase FrmB